MQDQSSYSDKELFLLIAEGDEKAFQSLFALYSKLLFPFLAQLTKSEFQSEEIIQETLLRIWIRRDQLPEIENPRSWTFRIASNLAYTWLSRKALEEKGLQRQEFQRDGEDWSGEESVALKELKGYLKNAIDMLPPQRKLIYQLSREGELSLDEIADQLKLSKSTVKNALLIATKAIREHLTKFGYIWLLWLLFKK